jgi:gentisate 1,2-dioxygenase
MGDKRINPPRNDSRNTMSTLKDIRQEISEQNLSPLWEIVEGLFSKEPVFPVRPLVWKGKKIIELLRQVGNMVVPGAEVGRRVLTLIHPDAKQYGGANWNLQVGFQLVKKGEQAPPHKHNAQASRFVIEGKAATVIDGERINMEPGDYVLTPAWTFHEHLLDEGDYILWLDTLDIPFVTRQGIAFFQDYESKWQDIQAKSPEAALRRATQRNMLPWVGSEQKTAKPYVYKWRDTSDALEGLKERNLENDYEGIRLTFSDPTSPSKSVFPTFGADMTLLRPGEKTKTHRHTSSAIYYVAQGQGYSMIAGKRYDWEKYDVIALPAWAWHQHVNTGSEDAVRLMLSDEPLVRNLGLYLEEPLPEGGA